jgi:hypothetical protein
LRASLHQWHSKLDSQPRLDRFQSSYAFALPDLFVAPKIIIVAP